MGYVVISYDISDDGGRSKVASTLEGYGQRVQYSVFECRIDEKTLKKLLDKIRTFPKGEDSIRVYRICEGCLRKVTIMGRGQIKEESKFLVV